MLHLHDHIRRLTATWVVLAGLIGVVPARVSAQELRPPSIKQQPSPARVQWDERWRRFRWWEYAATPVFGAASIYLHYYAPLPVQAKWQGDNLLDDTIRGWLVAGTSVDRMRAGQASDILWWGGTAMPFVVDLPVVLFAHRQPELAWQVLWMDLEANAVAGFINNALFYEVGRGRPSHASCAADPSYDPLCGGTGNNASFPSGHVLGIATGAGLTCVHHRYLPLYGNPTADASACALMSVATAITGITRVMADRHYTSDVLVGAGIGFASGYGLPWLLHYRTGSQPAHSEARPVALLPFGGAGSFGLGVVGAL